MKRPQFPFTSSDSEPRTACVSQRKKRREKMLDGSDIRLLVLHFLSQGDAHGYELIKAIEDLSKGEYTPSPGIIYPSLTLLEETAMIAAIDPQAARKAYRLEPQGRDWLQRNQPDLVIIMQRLSSLAVLVHNRSVPEVERAIHNMKTALNSRLSQQDISQETLYAIVDALDEAAKKIERS
ncbi:PadR family transcriptional regulator [Erwinia sp. S38]|uniref:PadR family transcriptional regulator n=1 Tax=Erwinia sp. S38 TaxID=2769338 RepID=UPI00190B1FC4|nr:PadR family transcriptional regulator [Erwinia sp. S38]MBK0002169.1 PadR family transcriptional regulator [Erwinia sp. S38]